MEKAVYPRKIQLKVQNLFTPSHFPNSSSGPDWSFCRALGLTPWSTVKMRLNYRKMNTILNQETRICFPY